MTPKFTLIAFHCNEIDLEDSRTRGLSDLAEELEETKEYRAEIYLGAYVFDTRKGWQNMHRLCEFLRSRSGSFLRLPFEAEIFGRVAPQVGKQLEALGVHLFPYPERDR